MNVASTSPGMIVMLRDPVWAELGSGALGLAATGGVGSLSGTAGEGAAFPVVDWTVVNTEMDKAAPKKIASPTFFDALVLRLCRAGASSLGSGGGECFFRSFEALGAWGVNPGRFSRGGKGRAESRGRFEGAMGCAGLRGGGGRGASVDAAGKSTPNISKGELRHALDRGTVGGGSPAFLLGRRLSSDSPSYSVTWGISLCPLHDLYGFAASPALQATLSSRERAKR